MKKACFIKQGNIEESYLTKSNQNHTEYWVSDMGNAEVNVFVLGFDYSISLTSYAGDSWWNRELAETFWVSGNKLQGCDQIWGSAITGITGVYGKKV